MDDRLERIGRLAAVSQGLEREGAYNGAKLLRALMESELVRHAAVAAPSGMANAGAALDELLVGMADHIPPEVAAFLPAIADHVRAGRTIPLDDAPPAHVCRACGRVFVGDLPKRCPVCEAPPLSYKEMLPIWYLEPVPPNVLLEELEASRLQVLAAVESGDDRALAVQPAPGEWSVRQALEHMLFAEGLFAERIARLIEEDEPNLASRAVWAETPTSDEGSADTDLTASQLAAEISGLRSATIARLSSLSSDGWQRRGWHPEWGGVTVQTQASYFGRHMASHMAQLAAAAEGRLAGR
ncbi:MAG: DinB family protein [Acidobacteria bacterium]|nr:DinB family protein [Acidobacteriota bacterium]